MSYKDIKAELQRRHALQIHWQGEGDGAGIRVYTGGLRAKGLPDLEIRRVPSFFFEAASKVLSNIGDYMLANGAIAPGQTFGAHDLEMGCRLRTVEGSDYLEVTHHASARDLAGPCCADGPTIQ